MPIAGLTDRLTQQTVQQGRMVRLGTLSKGKREGFGRQVKLYDLPYFRFSPAEGFEILEPVFAEAYGEEPTVIDDVRIPTGLAGNFKIEDCAWLTAGKHTERGSVFLARSDGENVFQARGDDGKVGQYKPGQLTYDAVTKIDQKGRDCYVYAGKLYPWQQTMAIDLILPQFNRLVFGAGVAGQGVITLITHSKHDITSLIAEYYAMLEEIISLLANPLTGNQDTIRRYLPLRDFPIRLYRAERTISTPAFSKDAEPSDRALITKSLLHWQLSPEVAAAMQQARDTRTYRLIEAVAQAPQLMAGDAVAQANADLFGDPQPQVALQASNGNGYLRTAEPLVDLAEILPADDLEAEAVEIVDVEPYDWREAAVNAKDLDGWAQAAYMLHQAVFADANGTKMAYTHIFGEFHPANNEVALAAITVYAQQVADGVSKVKAIENARAYFDYLLADEQE